MVKTGDGVKIRPVGEDDGDNGLFDVLSQLTEAPAMGREEFVKLLNEQNAQNARLTIVAVDAEGRVLGTGSVMVEPKFIRGGRPCGHIEDIVVDKKARGMQLGKRIISYLVDHCKERGCYKVMLDCADDNVPFYEKCGFNPKERQMVHYF